MHQMKIILELLIRSNKREDLYTHPPISDGSQEENA